jgi:hypothetical protein
MTKKKFGKLAEEYPKFTATYRHGVFVLECSSDEFWVSDTSGPTPSLEAELWLSRFNPIVTRIVWGDKSPEWWKNLRAPLNQNVPYNSIMQGDTPYLEPVIPEPPDETWAKLFGGVAQPVTQFMLNPRVVHLGHLNTCITQLRHWFASSNAEERATASSTDRLAPIRFGYRHAWGKEPGYYFFVIENYTFILPPTEPSPNPDLSYYDQATDR